MRAKGMTPKVSAMSTDLLPNSTIKNHEDQKGEFNG